MVGEKLREARKRSRLKQSDVGKMIGCAATSLTNWECGKVEPPVEKVEKLCELYGIHPYDLLEHSYSIADIMRITDKTVEERDYEEIIALSFCHDLLVGVNTSLDTDDLRLLSVFHSTKPEMRRFLLAICDSLIENESNGELKRDQDGRGISNAES